LCQLNLLRQAHEQDLWPLGDPFLVQLVLCGGALDIVGRLEALQQGGQGSVYFGREDRHGVWMWWVSWAATRRGSDECAVSAVYAEGKGSESPSVGGGGVRVWSSACVPTVCVLGCEKEKEKA
jgi:hypothetical protein